MENNNKNVFQIDISDFYLALAIICFALDAMMCGFVSVLIVVFLLSVKSDVEKKNKNE